jgi:L-ribulose-5-phosphate 3-epimerase
MANSSDTNTLTRRKVLHGAASFALAFSGPPPAAQDPPLRVGIMDVIIGFPSSPDAFAAAEKVGFEGIQVMLGKSTGPDRLVLSDPDLQQRILRSSAMHHVAITSTYVDILHRDCLGSSDLARTWVRESIRITKALNAGIAELASFFKCGLNSPAEIEGLVNALRELAPEAARARVVLGSENTLSAEDNARILDRVASAAVKIWYDIGNSTNIGHFDVPKEIRFLGKQRICQIHIKDKVYLGSGDVDVKACLEAIHDIGYNGWCVFETAAPSGAPVADAGRNLKVFREIERSLSR